LLIFLVDVDKPKTNYVSSEDSNGLESSDSFEVPGFADRELVGEQLDYSVVSPWGSPALSPTAMDSVEDWDDQEGMMDVSFDTGPKPRQIPEEGIMVSNLS
jgi:hypothetical protein